MLRTSWYGCWLRVLCAVVVLVGGCVNRSESPPEPRRDVVQSSLGELLRWPERILEDSKDTFTEPNNIWLLVIAGGASVAMHNSQADHQIQDSVENHQAIDGFFSESLKTIGNPGTHFAATGVWYALAVDANDRLSENRAWTMMTALAINGLVTVGLKAARNNRNPNGNRYAWPSGHTSSSFTVAAVLNEFYGPKVGIPAYALASLVAYRMVEEGDHWASDAVFGAALGWAIGHTVASKQKALELAGFEVVPLATTAGEPAAGIALARRF